MLSAIRGPTSLTSSSSPTLAAFSLIASERSGNVPPASCADPLAHQPYPQAVDHALQRKLLPESAISPSTFSADFSLHALRACSRSAFVSL